MRRMNFLSIKVPGLHSARIRNQYQNQKSNDNFAAICEPIFYVGHKSKGLNRIVTGISSLFMRTSTNLCFALCRYWALWQYMKYAKRCHTYHVSALLISCKSHGSAFGIATGYGLDERQVSVRVSTEVFLTSPYRSDRLWGAPSLPSNGYRGLFPRGYTGRGVK
jgi:hypothetical protein